MIIRLGVSIEEAGHPVSAVSGAVEIPMPCPLSSSRNSSPSELLHSPELGIIAGTVLGMHARVGLGVCTQVGVEFLGEVIRLHD
jgi:hypothetical protein